MSNFLVSNESISKMSSVLCDIVNDELTPVMRDRFSNYHLKRQADIFMKKGKLDYKTMCHYLYGLNCRALTERYNDKEFPIMPMLSKKNASILLSDNLPSIYKMIQCYLYQCSEGDVPSDPLYQLMRSLQNEIACYYLERTPQYNDADWG